jgi:hypothetical protein
VAREFPIYERLRLQTRLEGFNIFNHPNFFNPTGASTQIGTSSFGQITTTGTNNARELQAAIRFTF